MVARTSRGAEGQNRGDSPRCSGRETGTLLARDSVHAKNHADERLKRANFRPPCRLLS